MIVFTVDGAAVLRSIHHYYPLLLNGFFIEKGTAHAASC
jgi:hypothetical protein